MINQLTTFRAGLVILAGEALAVSARSTHVPVAPILRTPLLTRILSLAPRLCYPCILVLFTVSKTSTLSVSFPKVFTIFM